MRELINLKLFNKLQLIQIKLGIENGIDVTIFANPYYSHTQMRQIRWGLENDIDVSKYSKYKYSAEKMEEIRKYLEEKAKKNKIEIPYIQI